MFNIMRTMLDWDKKNKSVGERIKDMSWFCTTYFLTREPKKSFILGFFDIIDEIGDLLENSDQNLEIDIRHFDIIVKRIEQMIDISERSDNPDHQLPSDSMEKVQKAKNFRSRFTSPTTKKDQDTDDQPEISSSSQSSDSDNDSDSDSVIKSEDQDVKDKLQEFLDNLEEPLSNEEREKFIKMDAVFSECGEKHSCPVEVARRFALLIPLQTAGPVKNAWLKYADSICKVNKFYSQSKRRKRKHKSSRDCSY